jgi:hypothetical protein
MNVAGRRQPLRAVLFAVGIGALGPGCFWDDFWDGDDAVVSQGPDAGTPDAGANAGDPETQQPWPSAPILRNEVTAADEALGRQALALMGSAAVGAQGSCRSCHALGRPTLTRWSKLTQRFADRCLARLDLGGPSQVDSMLACFRSRSAAASSTFDAADFGIYSVAAHLPWFSFVFQHASGTPATRIEEQQRFLSRVGMPRTGRRLSQTEFDVLAEWFTRGTPKLFELVTADSGEDCTPGLDPSVAAHVNEMRSSGWRAKNREVPLLMFGCGPGQAGSACLGQFPRARDETYAAEWDVVPDAQIRILHDNSSARSTFWSRSSADGRYIGSGLLQPNGSGFSGQLLDLQQARTIDANFSYDATFFPDNSGFVLQQGGNSSSGSPGRPNDGSAEPGDVALICDQSVLSGEPERITGEEGECIRLSEQIGLYQQLAKSVDGGDYWAITGSYESDDGGFERVLENPSAAFEADSLATLTPMLNQGSRFEAGTPIRLPTPRQGDPVLSSSGRLLVTRMKGSELMTTVDGFEVVTAEQSGYALHTLSMTRNAGALSAALEDVGRICLTGGKAAFSLDERWLVLHHYVTRADAISMGFSGPGDPGFAGYAERGASNLYLVDLTSGESRRITNALPGQYALFPHFRSDGWIYFVVRTLAGNEYFAASDAALHLEASVAGE